MSVSGPQGSFPHFESAAPVILRMMQHNPYASVGSPFYPPYFAPRRLRVGRGVSGRFGNVYRNSYDVQRGAGVGGLFRSAFRTFAPVLRRGVDALASEGLRAGSDFLEDVRKIKDREMSGSVGAAARRRVSEVGRRMKQKLPQIIVGEGKKRKRLAVVRRVGGGKKKRVTKGRTTTVLALGGCPAARKVGRGKKKKKISGGNKKKISGGGKGKKKKKKKSRVKSRKSKYPTDIFDF